MVLLIIILQCGPLYHVYINLSLYMRSMSMCPCIWRVYHCQIWRYDCNVSRGLYVVYITPLISRPWHHALDITPLYHAPSMWGPLYECPHTFMHSYLHTHTHTHTRATPKCIHARTPHTHALVRWHVLMRIRIPISMCVYACGCICVYACMCVCVCVYIRMHVYMYACVCMCMCVRTHICM